MKKMVGIGLGLLVVAIVVISSYRLKKREDLGSEAYQRMAINFREAAVGKHFQTRIESGMFSLDHYINIGHWVLDAPYQIFKLYELTLFFEDGTQLEILKNVEYALPPITLADNLIKPYRNKYIEQGLLAKYVIDTEKLRKEKVARSPVFRFIPQLRERLLGKDLAEIPELPKSTQVTLRFVYSFDDEEEIFREDFHFCGTFVDVGDLIQKRKDLAKQWGLM